MAVGAEPIEQYEGEDVVWDFTVSIDGVSDISTWDVELVVKETAADADPPLVGPVTCTFPSALVARASFNLDVAPGEYVYSLRRVDSGFNRQLAHAALTVKDSASIDFTP